MASARSSGAAAGQLGSLYSLGAAGSLTDGQLLERFLARDDPAASEAAFTALVDRHGAMVLCVCRRELGDPHDAHDAFQATFLVLVSKAATIRNRESVGGWLVRHRPAGGGAGPRRGRPAPPPSRAVGRERAALGGRPLTASTPRRRAGLRPADRRGRPAPRAVPRPGRPALLRGPEHRGDRAAAGLRPRHGAVAAVAGPRSTEATARAPRRVARGAHPGRRCLDSMAAARAGAGLAGAEDDPGRRLAGPGRRGDRERRPGRRRPASRGGWPARWCSRGSAWPRR